MVVKEGGTSPGSGNILSQSMAPLPFCAVLKSTGRNKNAYGLLLASHCFGAKPWFELGTWCANVVSVIACYHIMKDTLSANGFVHSVPLSLNKFRGGMYYSSREAKSTEI